MRRLLNIINEALQKWPDTISGHELASAIQEYELHHTPEDFYDGDIYYNISSYGAYNLKSVPVSELKLGMYVIQDDLVNQYRNMQADTAPPIVIDSRHGLIIDGNHRANAAAKRGDATILAYVSDPDTYNPDEEPEEWTPDLQESLLTEGVVKIGEKVLWSNPQKSQVMALIERFFDLRAVIIGSDIYFGDASVWTHYQMFTSLKAELIIPNEWRFQDIIAIVIAPKKQRVDSQSYGQPYRLNDNYVFYASGRYRDAMRTPNFARIVSN